MYKEENDKLVEIEQENITVLKGGSTDYKELENKPSINNVTLVDNLNLEDLGINNFSGDYTELKNKPTIPAKLSDLENDSDFISEIPVASASTLGGIKVGDNLEITADGVLNALGGGSTGITILEGTEETPVNLQNLTEAGLYFVKNCYVTAPLYSKNRTDRLIINSSTPNNVIQMFISTDSSGRFYWYSRMYNKITKRWDREDFSSRYNDVTDLNDDSNYYNGRAILSYYGKKTKLETTNKNDLVEAINELVTRVAALEKKAGE